LIIHATAFGPPEFARIAKAGAKVVWSPQSNIALYGKSMNVEAAIKAGVDVSLGVDWSPSGSSNILEELRVADRVNRTQMHNVVRPDQWVSMITQRPARALSLGDYIGTLAPGKKADITVLKRRASGPNASLLKAEMRDVEMVWIGGRLLYGEAATVEAVHPGTCEAVETGGVAKKLCVADPASQAPGATETFAEIDHLVRAAYPNPIPLVP
jgi:cytosine/adenosine deaminase-related metal-dependent hydrolase